MYTPQVLDHFQNPRNVGEVEEADATVEVQNPACGDILRLSVKLDEQGRVRDVRFRARGCVPAIACGSRLTEMMAGRDADELGGITRDSVIESLGGLPPASGHAGQLAIDALQAILKQVRTNTA